MIELHRLISGPYEDSDGWYNIYLVKNEKQKFETEEIWYDSFDDAYEEATWLNNNVGPILWNPEEDGDE